MFQRHGDCRGRRGGQDAGYEPAPRLSFAKPRSLSLFPSQNRSIVGASGSEAARTTLTAGDFYTVYQLGAVFDVLGMVAATERARGNPSGLVLHVFDGTRKNGSMLAFEETGCHVRGCYSGAGSSRSAIFRVMLSSVLAAAHFLLGGNKNRAGGQKYHTFSRSRACMPLILDRTGDATRPAVSTGGPSELHGADSQVGACVGRQTTQHRIGDLHLSPTQLRAERPKGGRQIRIRRAA